MTRFPLLPLARAAGVRSWSQAAALFGVDRVQLYRWRDYGLTADQADELACRVNLHPVNIWSDWTESVPVPVRRVRQKRQRVRRPAATPTPIVRPLRARPPRPPKPTRQPRLRQPVVDLCPGSGLPASQIDSRCRAVCAGCGASVAVNPTATTLRRHGRRCAA